MPGNAKYNNLYYSKKTPQGIANGEYVTLSTQLILEAADQLGVSWKILPGTKIIELKYQDIAKYFRYQISTETTDVGFYACLDKSTTNALLENAGVSVSESFRISPTDPESYWLEVFEALPKPIVVKPTHGNQGRSVSLGIVDKEKYLAALKDSLAFMNDKEAGAVVETQFDGKEYRIVASRKKVLGVIYRIPANVVGDGVQNIQALITEKNADPRRFDDPNESLVKIKVDDHVMGYLKEQNLELTTVPAKGERIFVRRNSNISTGGDSIDVTDLVHPTVNEIAVKAMNAIPGLDFGGIDLMTKDIEAEQTADSYRIIEINSSPGFSINQFPFEGTPRNLAKEFLYISFPSLVASV